MTNDKERGMIERWLRRLMLSLLDDPAVRRKIGAMVKPAVALRTVTVRQCFDFRRVR